jgi:N-acetylglucosaminyldiphosphoundecaprenol N-acetyl-beta-D-mannosaminyltransferase
MYDAINKGVARSQGPVWAWLNSDEQYLPGTLAYVAEWFARNPDTDILCGDALLTDDRGNPLSYRRIIRPTWLHTRLVHLGSLSCASFYRRSATDRAGGFDTSWRSIGDAEWMARMIRAGIRIRTCGELLSTFAFTGQNTSESPIAAGEISRWRTGSEAPARWLTHPTKIIHRFRKWRAGAYHRRTFDYAIHASSSSKRVVHQADRIGWGWPSAPVAVNVQNTGLTNVPVLGTQLLATSYEALSEQLLESLAKPSPLAVDFANTHVLTMRRHETPFGRLAACMDLVIPDGMPLVWAMNARGAGLRDRVYGPTFTRRFLASCPGDKTHYLVGGSEECGRRFRERMLALNPSLNFIGGYHGRCSLDGLLDHQVVVLAEIVEKRPDFIWVGLGTPKQYGWIARIKPLLDHGVLLAVGFAFDVNAGMKTDAPLWMQRLGLTWLYRMASEPRRLITRYLKWNVLFLAYLAAESLRGKGNSAGR